MKLVDVTYDHLLHVLRNLREADRQEINATAWDESPEAHAERLLAVSGGSWIALVDDVPVAAGGGVCAWPGMWSMWMIATPDFDKCALSVTRFAKKDMIPALKQQGARRLQCHTLDTHKQSQAWLEALGAKYESTLHNYGKNGETFYCFSWVF